MSSAASPEHKSSSKPAAVLKDSEFNWEDPLNLDGDLTEEELRDRIALDEAKVRGDPARELAKHGRLIGIRLPPGKAAEWRSGG